MKILNLGCGTKVSPDKHIINIDWSIFLVIKKNPFLRLAAPIFIKGDRWRRFEALPDNIMVHNLANGIPFESNSVDVVYHSHTLEHLDRNIATNFLSEVKRVLKKDGIQRIVVPDFEKLCKEYLSHLALCDADLSEISKHDAYVSAILEQCVRREADGTSRQKPVRKFIENLVLGDARKRGETHQWMYDRFNLGNVLTSLGFKNVKRYEYNTSSIPNWNEYGLDLDNEGKEYKPESLYMEAQN
jgi:SAM-dependent methyltransferase